MSLDSMHYIEFLVKLFFATKLDHAIVDNQNQGEQI